MPTHLTILFRLTLAAALLTITYLAVTSTSYPVIEHVWDKINHFVAFLVLAWLLDYSFPRVGLVWWKIGLLFAYGAGLELIQYTLADRYFSLLDIVADAAGLAAYFLVYPYLKHIDRLTGRTW